MHSKRRVAKRAPVHRKDKPMPDSSVPHREVVDYWSRREDECGLGVDWADGLRRCWRCGFKSVLHGCHIVPGSKNGLDAASNLVLLCGRCHREAPNVADARFMWIWLRSTCVSLYDMYWTERGVQEFEKMFGRKPFATPEFASITAEQTTVLLRKQMSKVTRHFGEGSLNPSTIASIFALIEEQVTGRLPESVVGTSGTLKANKA